MAFTQESLARARALVQQIRAGENANADAVQTSADGALTLSRVTAAESIGPPLASMAPHTPLAPEGPPAPITDPPIAEGGPVHSGSDSRSEPEFWSVDAASARLSLSAVALRARCRRAARREGRDVCAHLGGGVVAHKVGRSWRIRFDAI